MTRHSKRHALVAELAICLTLGGKTRVCGDRMIEGVVTAFDTDEQGWFIKVGRMVPEQPGVRVEMPGGKVEFIVTRTIEEAGELLAEAELLMMRA